MLSGNSAPGGVLAGRCSVRAARGAMNDGSISVSSREGRERLIEEVRRCPALYDTRHELHRDIDARDRCWLDISARLGANSEVLKREWKILRDSLRQSLKKSGKGAFTKAGTPCKKWRYQARMAFLLPYMTNRRSRRVLKDEVKMDESEPAECRSPEGPEGGAGGEHDALELFFASVCQSAKRLSRAAQAGLKRDVLEALLRAEELADRAQKWEPDSTPQ